MIGMKPYNFWQLKIAISIIGAAASAFTTFRQTLMTEDMMSRIQHRVPLGLVLKSVANRPKFPTNSYVEKMAGESKFSLGYK